MSTMAAKTSRAATEFPRQWCASMISGKFRHHPKPIPGLHLVVEVLLNSRELDLLRCRKEIALLRLEPLKRALSLGREGI
jgi:hypothetical protein